MLPGPLAPLDHKKTRALTTIYAPRKPKTRKHKTAQSRMLDNNLPVKSGLSPFHPLPAIGQKIDKESKTKLIVFDLNENETRKSLDSRTPVLQDILKPLTPLRIQGFARKNSLDLEIKKKPQQLLRENTYDVIEPVYVNAAKLNKDLSLSRRVLIPTVNSDSGENVNESKVSPKTRFKKAALQVAKLSSVPETGKLLCLRERETFNICSNEDQSSCRLQALPRSPTQKLSKLSEIFQSLEMKGRQKDKMKKENSWF